MINKYAIESVWIHVAYEQKATMREVYGFSGTQGKVNLEAILFKPLGFKSKTLLVYMHPASTMQLLPVTRAMATAGVDVLCAGSRYARNDTPAILENVLADMGAYIRYARERLGYSKVVLAGWSGGGSLSTSYQAQAEQPKITETAAGDPIDLTGLVPADALIYHAAALSRAGALADFIDPSVLDENNPDIRDFELDLYDPRNPNKPPYSPDYIRHFRGAQRERMRRRTAYALELLDQFHRKGGKEGERSMLTHRTLADPRFLDTSIDPNDRRANWCFMGDPETANYSPAGIGRYSTARSWLSQWSIEHTQIKAEEKIGDVTVPLLAIEHTADEVVPQPHTSVLFDSARMANKEMTKIKGATHYFTAQPEMLAEAVNLYVDFLERNNLLA